MNTAPARFNKQVFHAFIRTIWIQYKDNHFFYIAIATQYAKTTHWR